MKKKNTAYRLLFLCPAVFGIIGFVVVDHMGMSDALFNCILMYLLNYADTPSNGWVELARWTAPLATASSILLLISSVKKQVTARIKTFFMDTVAVYGPEEEATPVLVQLGKRGLYGEEKLLPARNYILLNEQEKNISFYETNKEAMRDAQVFMRCDSLPAQSVSPANVHLFQPDEIAARLFWKSGVMLTTAAKKGGKLNIAFVGFGKLGEELLYWGLQNNIFSPDQEIRYHVFGDASDFLSSHPMLDQIGDPVLTYADSWKNHLPVLMDADLILVPFQDDGLSQETIVYQILSLVPEKQITVFTSTPALLTMLDEQPRLQIIDVAGQALQVSHIMESDLLRKAMHVNLRYAHLYSGVEETEENAKKEWEKLSAFLRYSNISTADYHEIRRFMIEQMGGGTDGSNLTAEQKEVLAELEHMRWCRYHWLNNWRYGVPTNGKAKDAAKRIHIDLIPYSQLSEPEKEKDRDTIDVLLGL